MMKAAMRMVKNQVPVITKYTANATFERAKYMAAGYTDYEVWVVGGAGGRSDDAYNNSSDSYDARAAGGGGGGSIRVRGKLSSLPDQVSCVVGLKGSDGSGNGANGANGGASSFGSIAIAGGGQGGIAGNASTGVSSTGGRGGKGGTTDFLGGGGGSGNGTPQNGGWNETTGIGSGGGGGQGRLTAPLFQGGVVINPAKSGAWGCMDSSNQQIPYSSSGEAPANGSITGGGGGGINLGPITGLSSDDYGSGWNHGRGNGVVLIKVS